MNLRNLIENSIINERSYYSENGAVETITKKYVNGKITIEQAIQELKQKVPAGESFYNRKIEEMKKLRKEKLEKDDIEKKRKEWIKSREAERKQSESSKPGNAAEAFTDAWNKKLGHVVKAKVVKENKFDY